MKATKHNYISQEGVDHISAQCEAFIKNKAMVNKPILKNKKDNSTSKWNKGP